ncbi:hornerin-like isoform X1 [Haliotis rubra]|uniref:hornerin-like isoform X1 n=1 Tax=Haliotis rubra TaxID=36100 RepID=UPI001EE55B72|nr:hornerin-like isoform X1 [Haliotis rubra]
MVQSGVLVLMIQVWEHPVHMIQVWEHPVHMIQVWEHPVHMIQVWEDPVHMIQVWEHPVHMIQVWEHPVHMTQVWEDPVRMIQVWEHPVHMIQVWEDPVRMIQVWQVLDPMIHLWVDQDLFDPGFNGPGAFDQGLGGHGPSNSYPRQGGIGPDPYPADVRARSTFLRDRLQGRHPSHQMALHERRRMGPTQLRSQVDMGNGFQDHPLSRNDPTNPNTFTEHSSRQLNPTVTDTQPRGSFGQQTGFSNTDQSGGLSGRFTGSAQSVLERGRNSLSQGTASFSSRNTAVADLVASPNRQAEGQVQSSQNLAAGGTLKSSLVSSQAFSSSGIGTNAVQALDGMTDPTGGAVGQTQSMLSQSGTQQQALSRQSQLASDHAGFTSNRKPSANEMTQRKMSPGMSHQHSGMSQDFANVRLQNARRDFSDPGMMSSRMSQTSRDASFLSDHPRSSMSQSSDMMTRPNWRMSARSNSHFNSHDMGREAALSGSSRFLQSRDRHQQMRSGSSFGHNSRRMSWNSPGSSDRMSSFSHQSTSPSFTRSRMAQRSQFVTRRLGMQSPSSMNSQFNGQPRFLSSAVGGTTKTFSKRPTVNSVHETPGVAETGKNGDTFQ